MMKKLLYSISLAAVLLPLSAFPVFAEDTAVWAFKNYTESYLPDSSIAPIISITPCAGVSDTMDYSGYLTFSGRVAPSSYLLYKMVGSDQFVGTVYLVSGTATYNMNAGTCTGQYTGMLSLHIKS